MPTPMSVRSAKDILPVRVDPYGWESLGGYSLRVMRNNCTSLPAVLRHLGLAPKKTWGSNDVALIVELTGVPRDWAEWRVPQSRDQVGRPSDVRLFGHVWRSDHTVRGSRIQLCPRCIRESGSSHFLWDLTGFVVCPRHGALLQDACAKCGRALSWSRPAPDVCACGLYLRGEPVVPDGAELLAGWSSWLCKRIAGEPCVVGAMPAWIAGLSPDGVYRVLLALAGGVGRLRSARLKGRANWCRTTEVADVLVDGLQRLSTLSDPMAIRQHMAVVCASDLRAQAVKGATAEDRSAAVLLLRHLGVPTRRVPMGVMHEQGDLFLDAAT